MPLTEIHSLSELQQLLPTPDRVWLDLVLQDLDLTSYRFEQDQLPVENCFFLGCALNPEDTAYLAARGVVLPRFAGLPFKSFRSALYTPQELYGTASLEDSWDRQVYHLLRDKDQKPLRVDVITTLAMRLHDFSVTDLLEEFLAPQGGAGRKVVAVMGSHRIKRNTAEYREVAVLGWLLTRAGFLVATGGGPGLMEAAHLGASLGCFEDLALLDELLVFEEDDLEYTGKNWLSWARRVVETCQRHAQQQGCSYPAPSLGIPTWFYGHEPSAVFASHIAKYFENSVREEGLLRIAQHGVVYGPGNAGTVQEVFQDLAQNYYQTYGFASPMVFLGRDFWNVHRTPDDPRDHRRQLFPLVQKMALEAGIEGTVHLLDTAREAVEVLVKFQPPPQDLQERLQSGGHGP